MAQHNDRPLIYVKLHAEGEKGVLLDVSDKILSLRYEDEDDKADRLSLTIDNSDLSEFDNPWWKKGGILEVSWGYPGNMTPPRHVSIQKQSGSTELRIEALGLATLLHKSKTAKVYKGMTLHQVASEVAKKHLAIVQHLSSFDRKKADNETSGIDIAAKEVEIDLACQSSQSDAQMVSKLARKHGFRFYIDHSGFKLEPIDKVYTKAVSKIVTWFNGNGEWIDFSYENDGAGRNAKTTTKGIDPASKKAFEVEASDEKTKRDGLAARVRDFSMRTGTQTLTDRTPVSYKEELAKATQNTAKSGGDKSVGRAEETNVQHSTTGDAKAAKRGADGQYKSERSHEHQLSGTVLGDPQFLAKSILKVEGLGRRLSGRWALSSVEHRIDSGGYLCSFKAYRDGDNGYGEKHEAKTKSKANIVKDETKTSETQKVETGHKWTQRTGEHVAASRIVKIEEKK